MTDNVKIVVTAPAEQAAPAETSPEIKVAKVTDNVAIISFIEAELLKLPGVRSKSLYCLQEGDRGYSRNYLTFKLTTDYSVADEDIKSPWLKAFNYRLWQHSAEAAKAKTPSLWCKDNLLIEVAENVQFKFWSFKLDKECMPVLRELIAIERGSAASTCSKKVSDFY